MRLRPSGLALPTLELVDPADMVSPVGRRVQTWPDPSGCVRISAYRCDHAYWIDWPGVARFIVTPGAAIVRAIPDLGGRSLTPPDVFQRFIVPLAWHAAGGEALHASAVCWGTSAVAFCANSGTGKSTVACGLAMRGRPLLTDDGLLIDDLAIPPQVTAVASHLRLRPASSAFFERPTEAANRSPAVTTITHGVLRGIVVLERVVGLDRPEMERLTGGHALAGVLAHAHNIDPTDAALRARSVTRYLACLADAPAWRLRYPSGFEHLPKVLDLVEQTVEASL